MRSFEIISLAITAPHVTAGIWKATAGHTWSDQVIKTEGPTPHSACWRPLRPARDGQGERRNQPLPYVVIFTPPKNQGCVSSTSWCAARGFLPHPEQTGASAEAAERFAPLG